MTQSQAPESTLRVALPKGRMQAGVSQLLEDAGIRIQIDARGYRPTLSLAGVDTKILKPQNIVEMLHVGSRDVGFAGADWVAELGADLVELLDTGLDPVAIVAAAPTSLLVPAGKEGETGGAGGVLPSRRLVIASEYERLTRAWIAERGLDAHVVRSYGATEVFPPEDADVIVDNSATGSTLRANGLEVVDELMRSSTRLFANPRSLDDPAKRDRLDHLTMLLRSVLDARHRVMVEVNVSAADLEHLCAALPCMRHPTIARLHDEDGYAVKAAVPRHDLPELIRELKARGGSDIVVAKLAQIVP